MYWTKEFPSFEEGMKEAHSLGLFPFIPASSEKDAVREAAVLAVFDRPTGNGAGWGQRYRFETSEGEVLFTYWDGGWDDDDRPTEYTLAWKKEPSRYTFTVCDPYGHIQFPEGWFKTDRPLGHCDRCSLREAASGFLRRRIPISGLREAVRQMEG